jgi:microcin C transport system permease protein
MSGAIIALTSLDFSPRRRRRRLARRAAARRQGEPRRLVDRLSDLRGAVVSMLLLTFIGDALRDAFDTRKS